MVSGFCDIQTKDDYTHPLGPETNFNEEARDLIVSNKIDVSPLISRVVSLDELPDVFEQLTSDRNRDQKVLVRPNG
jgi:threonine dehydrogenase-like Zn-dependent dehydrogenase